MKITSYVPDYTYLPSNVKHHGITELIPSSISISEYQSNAQAYREQAILRAAQQAPIQIRKNEDGSVWIDTDIMRNLENPEWALARMRESGGYQEIAWEPFIRAIQGTSSLDLVAVNIDYWASEYAQYQTYIEQNFSGEKQTSNLTALDQRITDTVHQSAQNFAQTVGEFLESNGVSVEQDKIYNSILDLFEQRKATYLRFIQENDNYAGVKGTEDEWLLTSGRFMGSQLRYAFLSHNPEMNLTSSHGYSIDDLVAAGTMVKEAYRAKDVSRSLNQSEEELGVALGMAAMKYELIANHLNMSDNMKAKLDQAFNSFINQEIHAQIAYIEQQRQDPYVRWKDPYAVDYDRKAVLSIIRTMVDSLKSDNLNAAFETNINRIVSLYKNKRLHYPILGRYFFYSSYMDENHTSDWNRFVKQLSSANEDLSRYLLKDRVSLVDVTV